MTREQQAEYLKEKIFEVLQSQKEKHDKPEREIKICHVQADLFIEMAYCFIAKHGK